jgi:hypothetical protein
MEKRIHKHLQSPLPTNHHGLTQIERVKKYLKELEIEVSQEHKLCPYANNAHGKSQIIQPILQLSFSNDHYESTTSKENHKIYKTNNEKAYQSNRKLLVWPK